MYIYKRPIELTREKIRTNEKKSKKKKNLRNVSSLNHHLFLLLFLLALVIARCNLDRYLWCLLPHRWWWECSPINIPHAKE